MLGFYVAPAVPPAVPKASLRLRSGHACPRIRGRDAPGDSREDANATLLLCRLYLVPYLDVLAAAPHILPEVKPLLIFVDVVEVQTLDFLRRHELCGLRIRRGIAGDICDFLLDLGLQHVIQTLMCQVLCLAAGGDHQVIDPARGVFPGDGFSYGKVDLAKLVG